MTSSDHDRPHASRLDAAIVAVLASATLFNSITMGAAVGIPIGASITRVLFAATTTDAFHSRSSE